MIDFIASCCPTMKHPYPGTIIELSFYNAFINVLRFTNNMELDIQQTALSFLLTLRHNSVMWFSNFNSESIGMPSNFSWELAARGIHQLKQTQVSWCQHSVHPPSTSAGGRVEPPTKFSKKRRGLAAPQLLEGSCWERGGLQFPHKEWKNSNWEILPKHLFTFKR